MVFNIEFSYAIARIFGQKMPPAVVIYGFLFKGIICRLDVEIPSILYCGLAVIRYIYTTHVFVREFSGETLV